MKIPSTKILPDLSFFALVAALLLPACSYKVEKEKEPTAVVDGSNLSFAQVRSLAFGPKCARCHGDDAWMNSYPAAKAVAQEISDRVQGRGPNRPMPPATAPQLTEAEKAAIVAWVAAGAPETPGAPPAPAEPPPPPPAPPEGLNFAYVKFKVLDAKCLRCHKAEFDTYEHTAPLTRDIEFRVQDIGGDGQMPPANRPQLTEEEKTLLLDWIKAGAPKENPAPPPPVRLTFAEIKAKVLDAKCLRCHKAELDTYEHTRPLLKEIEFRVQDIGGDAQMPPANKPQLTEPEKQMLLDWIRAGAPNE